MHLAGRLLLPLALRWRLPANAVSLAGLAFGAGAAFCFFHWRQWRSAAAGFVLCTCWLIADGLDGMIARATGTASPLGRFLDGVCDHLVFVFLYVALAASLEHAQGWALAIAAGVAHALQATLYEGERARFHRRIRGDPGTAAVFVGQSLRPRLRRRGGEPRTPRRAVRPVACRARPMPLHSALLWARASPALRLMALLSNNMRVLAIFLACLAGNPAWFWWLELGPLSVVALVGILWHRRIERQFVNQT